MPTDVSRNRCRQRICQVTRWGAIQGTHNHALQATDWTKIYMRATTAKQLCSTLCQKRNLLSPTNRRNTTCKPSQTLQSRALGICTKVSWKMARSTDWAGTNGLIQSLSFARGIKDVARSKKAERPKKVSKRSCKEPDIRLNCHSLNVKQVSKAEKRRIQLARASANFA